MTGQQLQPFNLFDVLRPGVAGLSSNPMERMFNRLPSVLSANAALMRSYVTDEGTAVCEFNLAGFSEDEITIKTDVARHELIITATKDDENNKRSFATNLLLSEYTHPEDISASYNNGVLTISVAPVDKRKEEALVDVPLNRSEKVNRNKKAD